MRTVQFLLATLLFSGLAGAETRRLVYNGYNLSYTYIDEAGSGAPTLIFIHGLACRSRHWAAQVEDLRGEARVVVVDLLGHGESDEPQGEYTMELFADNVAAVMDQEGIHRAVLVGHSMGVAVIRAFARQEPARLGGIVAVDGLLAIDATMRQMVAPFVARFDGPEYEQTMTGMVESFFVATTPDAVRQEVRDSMLGTTPRVVRSAMKSMYDESVWAPVEISVPVVAIMATSTPVGPDYEGKLRAEFPQLDYHVVADTGHFVMMESPAAVNETIRALLKRLAGS